MINPSTVDVGIGDVVVNLIKPNGTIKRITQWVTINIQATRPSSWVVELLSLTMLLLLSLLIRNIGIHDHVELVLGTTIAASRQEESAQKQTSTCIKLIQN